MYSTKVTAIEVVIIALVIGILLAIAAGNYQHVQRESLTHAQAVGFRTQEHSLAVKTLQDEHAAAVHGDQVAYDKAQAQFEAGEYSIDAAEQAATQH
jgi:Tfp pilus assembly protein PilE